MSRLRLAPRPAMKLTHWQAFFEQRSILMRSQLASHFQRTRERRELSRSQLAQMLGYANVSKGCNKIQKFEERGEIHGDLLRKLTDALGIDYATINDLIEQDRRAFEREWNEWADQPIRPHLVIRLMAAAYLSQELPEQVTTLDEAEKIAAQTARERNMKVCLVWTRRISVWFGERGDNQWRTESRPGKANIPTMRLSGSKRTFTLRHPATGETILRMTHWPKQPTAVTGNHLPSSQPE